MAKASATIEINASKKKVFDVISDFESYPDFLPETKTAVIDKHTKTKYTVTFTLDVIKTITYTLEMTVSAPNELSWTLVKGDMMKSNTGRWILEEVKKGLTKATYEIDVDLGLLVPSAVTKTLISRDLPKMLKHFKERVEG